MQCREMWPVSERVSEKGAGVESNLACTLKSRAGRVHTQEQSRG